MSEPLVAPDSPGDLPGFVVMNPSAIGNPDETPRVFVGDALVAYFNPCKGGPEGWCGGVNGFHQETCTVHAGRSDKAGDEHV